MAEVNAPAASAGAAPQESIEQRLQRLAVRLRGPSARVEDAQRLSGGASMETWAFAIVGAGEREELILRRQDPSHGAGSESQAGIAAEAALIAAVAQTGAPAPPLVHLCDAKDGLGEAHVTRRIAGETLGRKIVEGAAFEAVRPRLAGQCGEILARIHATPPPPPAAQLKTYDAAAVLDRYEQAYRVTGAERPILELGFQHLRRHAPPPAPSVLLHGDFRTGNLIVDPQRGVAAVLDWELAHIGDPAEDLGWLCVNSWRFGRPDRPVGGFGGYDELLDAYAAAGGAPMTRSRVRYWQAIGSLKWAVMCLGMYGSWAARRAGSVERPMIGRRSSEAEMDLIELLEAGL